MSISEFFESHTPLCPVAALAALTVDLYHVAYAGIHRELALLNALIELLHVYLVRIVDQ